MVSSKGFTVVKREGRDRLVLPSGAGEVSIDGGSYVVYNSNGIYLGCTKDLRKAKYMAEHGYPNQMDKASDLSLWVLWNDAVQSGVTILENKETGEQFLNLGCGTMMTANEDKHGWDTNLMSETDFFKFYSSSDYPSVIALSIALTPFRLE